MKRYIEIVYDNSGSMNSLLGSKNKFEVAQDLFEKEILPTIGLRGDHVVLRLLRKGCENLVSTSETLPNQRNLMLDRIKSINHDQSTPLFYTVYDAVEACRNVKADEYLIFVLTDGDDTCGVKIEDLIDEETRNKYIRFYKVLLVQLAVESATSRNNLTAFASALGGQAIALDSKDSVTEMRSKLKVALNVSGFSNKLPLAQCFDHLPGFDVTWNEIEESGIDYHQAMLLHQKGLLSWMPEMSINVSVLQLAELKFLFALLFKSGLPEDLTRTMLSQLKKPYYYSFDCIYWDFGNARWRYFLQQNHIKQVPNPEALSDDFKTEKVIDKTFDHKRTHYFENEIYEVVMPPSLIPSFELVPVNKTLESEINGKQKVRILEEGDNVEFKWR